ncbi:MAG: hypothetical protein E3J66_00110 [Dehalococcoidia bacterium]|nr:MAG: hypothetical protein E3J66_00110 [Dehalococcoidia bacterium]
MIVDKLGNTIFVEMSFEERDSLVKILRQHAANLDGFSGKVGTMRGAEAVARLEIRVKQIKDWADSLEEGG